MSGPRRDNAGDPVPEGPDAESLFEQYHPRVYAYVRYRVSDVDEAEDLTSEIMERVLAHLGSYDARKGSFSTWLFRIAHNLWVNHWKRQQRRARYHVELGAKVEDLAADNPTPEQTIIHEEEVSRALACLSRLPTRQQEILALRFAGRLTNREIAHVLKMNERTVSVTILRALRRLRQLLEETER